MTPYEHMLEKIVRDMKLPTLRPVTRERLEAIRSRDRYWKDVNEMAKALTKKS